MIERSTYLRRIRAGLKRSPIVALLGPRQCGKTTLAREFLPAESANYFDLGDPTVAAVLEQPMTALQPLRGLVVIDEAQRQPGIFPVLRVLADRAGEPATFLILGSASPDLSRQAAESLAGRVEIIELRGFDGGEALLCIGATHYSYHLAMVTGIANKAMSPHLARVFDAIGELANDQKKASADLPAGDLLHKVITETQMSRWELTAGYWCSTEAGDPDEQQAAELKKLRFSSRFHSHFGYGTFTYAVPRHRLAELRKAQEPGQRMVITHADAKVPLLFAKGEPLPETIVEQIYATSVEDAEKAMQTMIHPEFESREERLHNFLYDEGLAVTVGNPEENERAFALMFRIQAVERGMLRPMYREVLQTTFSQNFRSTPPKSLLGTGPINQLSGGHVIPSQDLIKRLIMATLEHAEQLLSRRNDEFRLLGRVIPGDDIAQQRDMNPLGAKVGSLDKPYTAVYRGLPIRVTECMEVCRADDAEGLAADFYIDRQNQAVHFVALYRVPAKKR